MSLFEKIDFTSVRGGESQYFIKTYIYEKQTLFTACLACRYRTGGNGTGEDHYGCCHRCGRRFAVTRGICRNYCLNYLRDKRQQEVPLSDVQENLLSIQELQIDADPHPLAYLENKEFEEKIYRAVDSLPAKCRDIFVQYLYHNKTYEEIAITNHISSSTVRVQIKIGLAKLRELLGDLYPLFLLIFNFFEK